MQPLTQIDRMQLLRNLNSLQAQTHGNHQRRPEICHSVSSKTINLTATNCYTTRNSLNDRLEMGVHGLIDVEIMSINLERTIPKKPYNSRHT